MVICFNCSEGLKRKLDLLVEKGQYSDYTAAISASIENQLLLEEQVAESGSVILRQATGDSSVHEKSTETPAVSVAQPQTSIKAESAVFASFGAVPAAPLPALAIVQEDACDGDVTPGLWLFGQYNKFLPVKANCRLLARLLRDSPSGVPLQAMAEAVQQEMPKLREWLEDFDTSNDLGRESALATAFPTKDTKSILRYTNQFVMSINKAGAASGFPVALGLLNRLDSKTNRISLTEAGFRFALLANPVFDEPHLAESRFSAEEIHFLVDHIRNGVRREHVAYLTVLRLIARGASTPEALDAQLKPGADGISAPYLSTQRAGVISRMTDLGLISRQREGIRVNYSLTSEGQAYLNEDEAAVA